MPEPPVLSHRATHATAQTLNTHLQSLCMRTPLSALLNTTAIKLKFPSLLLDLIFKNSSGLRRKINGKGREIKAKSKAINGS